MIGRYKATDCLNIKLRSGSFSGANGFGGDCCSNGLLKKGSKFFLVANQPYLSIDTVNIIGLVAT